MEEVWKVIPEYSDYKVSNTGRVWGKFREMKGTVNGKGYKVVGIGPTYLQVHILVNTLFNGPKPFEGAMTLHKDDVKLNNNADNLYWGTHQQNVADSIANGRRLNLPKGEDHYNAQLTQKQVDEIRKLRQGGMKLRELSERYGFRPQYISMICRNKSWKQ